MPSSREREPANGSAELRTRLVWLMLFRTVATSLSLVVTVARLLAGPEPEPTLVDWLCFAVIAGAFVSTLISGLRLRRGTAGRLDAAAQVVGDILIATGLVFLSGGAESPFTFTYSLAVIGAAIVLNWEGALAAATGSVLAFAAVVAIAHANWTPATADDSSLSPVRAAFLLGSNVLAIGLIAVLASYLSRQLSVTGGQLSAREADLRRLASLQQHILASMPSGLITCDGSGRVTFVNAAGAAILHTDPHLASGALLAQVMPGVEVLTPRSTRGELSLKTPGGVRTLGLSVTPLEGDTGALLVVFQDLTELRRMEEDLRRVDRLAGLGTLSAQLAHEIRNPLAAMRGSAQLLVEEVASDGTARKLSTIVLREADRLARLVDDFLRFARPAEPTRQLTELTVLATETVEMLRADPLAREVKLELSAPQRTLARVDPDQVRQVLINLIRNACQAAGPDGEVKVQLEATEREARIRIWDSAGSISPSSMPRLFEPFFTTRDGGTGLGLSTAHSIVRAHGGSIRAQSSPAEGTEFIVGLPL